MVSLTNLSPDFGLVLASHFRKKHNYMRKFPASLLLTMFLVISVAGFSQNSKPISGVGKDSVKAIASPPTQGEKAKEPGDGSNSMTSQPPTATQRNNAGNIRNSEKNRRIAMRKKELRKQIQGLPDTGEFIYDLNAFYSLGK
jgi:hypothetical protein